MSSTGALDDPTPAEPSSNGVACVLKFAELSEVQTLA